MPQIVNVQFSMGTDYSGNDIKKLEFRTKQKHQIDVPKQHILKSWKVMLRCFFVPTGIGRLPHSFSSCYGSSLPASGKTE